MPAVPRPPSGGRRRSARPKTAVRSCSLAACALAVGMLLASPWSSPAPPASATTLETAAIDWSAARTQAVTNLGEHLALGQGYLSCDAPIPINGNGDVALHCRSLGTAMSVLIYAEAGERVALRMRQSGFAEFNGEHYYSSPDVDHALIDPQGTVVWSGGPRSSNALLDVDTSFTSTVAGVWELRVDSTMLNRFVTWEVAVVDGSGAARPGRVWSERWTMYQRNAQSPWSDVFNDLTFHALNEFGVQYEVGLDGYAGLGSMFQMDTLGIIRTSTGDSADMSIPSAGSPEWSVFPEPETEFALASKVAGSGAAPYRLFLEPPSTDIPTSIAAWADGRTADTWGYVGYTAATITELGFTRDSRFGAAGTVTGRASIAGVYEVAIDVDGNGAFTDPVDATIPTTVDQSGALNAHWDGLDGLGQAASAQVERTFHAYSSRVSPIYLIRSDAEGSTGGVRIVQRVGPATGAGTVFWSDAALVATSGVRASSTTPIERVSPAGIMTAGGAAHAWGYAPAANDGVTGPWGDLRDVVDWSYLDDSAEAFGAIPAAEAPVIDVVKTGTTQDTNGNGLVGDPGDTIVYEIEVSNLGATTEPSILLDDALLGVDDAECLTAPLAPTQSAVCIGTFEHVITAADAAAGSVTNVVEARVPGLDPVDDDDVQPTTDLTPVTPAAPTLVPADACEVEATVQTPTVTGIHYAQHRQDATVTVTAVADPGYTIPPGVTAEWTLTIPPVDACPAPIRLPALGDSAGPWLGGAAGLLLASGFAVGLWRTIRRHRAGGE